MPIHVDPGGSGVPVDISGGQNGGVNEEPHLRAHQKMRCKVHQLVSSFFRDSTMFNDSTNINQHILKTNPNVGRYNPSKNLGDFANPHVACCPPKNEGLKENKLGFSFYFKISRIQWFNTLNVRCNNKRKGSTKNFFRRQPKLRKQLETIRCFPAKNKQLLHTFRQPNFGAWLCFTRRIWVQQMMGIAKMIETLGIGTKRE